LAKVRASGNGQKAMQQQIASGMDRVLKTAGDPSKAELRASIPAYDPSMIKKIPAGKTTKKGGVKS
jgi:hypothetical protein